MIPVDKVIETFVSLPVWPINMTFFFTTLGYFNESVCIFIGLFGKGQYIKKHVSAQKNYK